MISPFEGDGCKWVNNLKSSELHPHVISKIGKKWERVTSGWSGVNIQAIAFIAAGGGS